MNIILSQNFSHSTTLKGNIYDIRQKKYPVFPKNLVKWSKHCLKCKKLSLLLGMRDFVTVMKLDPSIYIIYLKIRLHTKNILYFIQRKVLIIFTAKCWLFSPQSVSQFQELKMHVITTRIILFSIFFTFNQIITHSAIWRGFLV